MTETVVPEPAKAHTLMQAEQLMLGLSDEVCRVHCFFGCPYVVESADVQEAHDLMERHYDEYHQEQIDWICYRLTGRWPKKEGAR
jgi:hypothetical protein